jgi:hypothetical protein
MKTEIIKKSNIQKSRYFNCLFINLYLDYRQIIYSFELLDLLFTS